MAQTMPSPVSPYQRQDKQSFSAQRSGYPSSPNPESLSSQHATHHGLGLFPCAMPPTTQTMQEISPSSEHWAHSPVMAQDYSQPSQPPDIFSAAFDPFSGYSSSPTTAMVGAHSPEAPGLEFCQTPPSSNIQSHRGSVSSSYAASDSYSPSGSDCAYTPRVKVEEAGEWYPSANNEHVLQRNLSSQGPMSYATGVNTLTPQTEDLYRTPPTDWSKTDTSGYITELAAGSDGRLPRFDVQPILPSGTRIKKKRQRTTPEEATHECRVCGKLFKRSYNWKSHMETHNPERKYPHPCTAMSGSTPCTKKFQRKTDLDRHYDSVHLKARNHKCSLCGNRFARRDTLRRHTEDGCPKRFELGIRESASGTPTAAAAAAAAAAANPSHRWSFSNFPPRQRSFSVGVPLQNSPMAAPPPPSSSATSTSPFPLYARSDYGAASREMATMAEPAYAT